MKKIILSTFGLMLTVGAFARKLTDSITIQRITVADQMQVPLTWITLGTQGGPALNAQRSQPANVLLAGGKPMIVDCGDGAMERFAASGFTPTQATTVFISHLHVDHIGGLQGLIAIHWFQGSASSVPLTIYGPPGTDKLVAGILQSLSPTEEIARAEQPDKWTVAASVKVVILKTGADLMVNGVRVRAVQNSHFDNPPGNPQDNGTQSLSLRFDYQNYAIGYTGDTGPSDAVIALERKVNILMSEVTMRGEASRNIGRFKERSAIGATQVTRQQQDTGQQPNKNFHFIYQHLSPESAAKLAAAAEVQQLVFTHLAILAQTDVIAPTIIRQAQQFFKGKIAIAHDLDRF